MKPMSLLSELIREKYFKIVRSDPRYGNKIFDILILAQKWIYVAKTAKFALTCTDI
jgi:hypothetical protein